MKLLFEFIVFPGFLFTAAAGMVFSWIDRKVTARVQWRQGPPFFQPLYDFVKLLGKETTVPLPANTAVFLLSPLFTIASTTLASLILWKAIINPAASDGLVVGDLIVVIYLLAITPLAVILGASSSANPIASLAASREMKLFLSYELPFIFSVLVPVVKSQTIKLGEIILYQAAAGGPGIILGSFSGVLAFVIFLLTIQAKLGLVPFDMAEAETEIAGGIFIEYSGVPLAIHKLNRIMLLFVIPVFSALLFFGGNLLGAVAVLVLIVLIRNTNPRVRIDQAVKFFWRSCLVFSIFAILLAVIGY